MMPTKYCPNCGASMVGEDRKIGKTLDGILSVVCGVVGLIRFSIVFGVMAIVSGFFARKKGDNGMGNVGIVLGLIDIVIGIVLLAIFAPLIWSIFF